MRLRQRSKRARTLKIPKGLVCYALIVQISFSCPALGFVSLPLPSSSSCPTFPFSSATAPHDHASSSLSERWMQSNSNDPGPPPFVERQFDATSLPPPEELPDDVPKDVSNEKLNKAINSKEKTLYGILGASPTATRAELKKKYVEMAKLSHPDAQIGRTASSSSSTDEGENVPDFGEVAAAWRILGDAKSRKRYDRELQYKQWSDYASKYANEKLEEAVPAVAKIMDDVAVPFLRRTAATTFAVSQAMSQLGKMAGGVGGGGGTKHSAKEDTTNSNGQNSLTDAFMNAINAGQNARRKTDTSEWNKKSQERSERAYGDETTRARQLAQQLSEVTEQRLFATLHSDEVALSSDEARIVLDSMTLNEAYNGERDNGIQRIEKEIEALEETEQHFMERLEIYEDSDREWNQLLEQQDLAERDLTRRKQEEFEARRQLEEAIRLVSEAKANLVTTSVALTNIEQRVRRNASEMDRVTMTLSKKQERVRHALRKKADMAGRAGTQLKYMSPEELAALRRKELQLSAESEQLERMVARLSSRAEQLKSRADAFDRHQRSGERFRPPSITTNGDEPWNGPMPP